MATSNLRSLFPPDPTDEPQEQKPRQPKSMPQVSPLRLWLVWGFLCLGMLGLGGRLFQLQILQKDFLLTKARQQQMVSLRPYIPRRSIVDRQGNVLATDRLVYSLYVHPKLFKKSKQEVAKELVTILDTYKPEDLVKRFNQRDTGIRLVYALPEDQADRIARLSLDGLELIQHYARFYPQEDMFAESLGYVNVDHRGQAGLEYSQEALLERQVMTLRLSRAGNGALIPAYLPEGLLNFDDLKLRLTLDMRLQRASRDALKIAINKYKAKRGAIIVMDVNTGELRALVSEPTYDPNEYSKANIALFKNWTVTDLYEPGSTMKPINVAIALDHGVIDPNSVFYDPGQIQVDRWTISNHDFASRGGNGNISVAQILQRSSNVGMIKIMSRLKSIDFYNALEKLGLDQKMGVDLPGEMPGHMKSKKTFTTAAIEPATTAFGQGFSLTPMKLVQLHASLANGGKLVTPHIVAGLVDPQGNYHWQPTLKTTQVFSPEITKKMMPLMESVVLKGSGKSSQIPGYRIGGKTGTAQKASPNGGYLAGAKITSYIAVVPVEKPRFVVLAVIDEPKGANTFGSTVTAPIVKSVMEVLLTIEKIPPSYMIDNSGKKNR